MKKIISVILLFILLISLIWNQNTREENILYSWSMDALNDKELKPILKKYQIKELYQDFSSSYLNETDDSFLKDMKKIGVKVYHLCGDPSWGWEKNGTAMKKEIDKVLNFNAKNDYKISGIVFDVEPYLHNEANFDFALFVDSMKSAYKHAKENNLYMVIAIATWFDSVDQELLEELIKNGCDEASLMNYNIKYTKENIQDEINYAQKYQKPINTIYEIDFASKDHFSSYEAIDADYKAIQKAYKYKKLKKAYHYYEKMKG